MKTTEILKVGRFEIIHGREDGFLIIGDSYDCIDVHEKELPDLIDVLLAIQNKDLNMLTETKKDAIMKSCEFCDKHCGNSWCHTNKE